MSKVSVIIPVYNSEKYIENTIKSILNQSFTDFELILVDDGSIDKSGKICDAFAKKDNRIKVIHQPNTGICGARNSGLSAAQSEYIMFSDNDDTMESNTIEENYNLIYKTGADIVKFGRRALYIENETIKRKIVISYDYKVLNKDQIKDSYLDFIYDKVSVCIWDGIYKKSILPRFNQDFKMGGEDIFFNIELLKKVSKIVLNDKVYYNHWIRKNISTSTKFDENKIIVKETLLRQFVELFENDEVETEKYNIIIIRDYINPICKFLNANMTMTKKEKRSIIKNIADYLINNSKILKMFMLSKKYCIEYIFIQLHLFDLLFKLLK